MTHDCRTQDTIHLKCTGPNPTCRKEAREGRPVHIIPAMHERPTIVLPTWHYPDEASAREAIAQARAHAPIVRNDEDLARYRKIRIAHRLPEGWIDPSRR
jgi:hypothetical protein